ncbi:hypothetical protein L226DRAFT_611920 [Lentinus tigrinus ALCF2SS1-7]|uniref:Uncharacterized protein n=1 Tax=Lentinus tigrinus ALCF2SS1-6 TaxID=1328759 RepID=A0A5C2SM49_9APHY|nr:hypothetical protein L227DRAFT_650536 [Lentinus tigrinus ALCF2SS1-6]RPD76578.1 hypothetical protein L226DRAFT_611920 [Lentinus tigrinus ALCF2SS1-7]
MDDLYQNAWSETTNTAATFKNGSTSSWTSPRITSSLHEEADLAAPSWSTGADISWNEPGSPGFSWSQTDADAGWGPSTYEGISLGKPSPQDETTEVVKPTEEEKDENGEQHDATVEYTALPSPSPIEPPSSPFSAPLTPPVPDHVLTQSYEVVVEHVAPPSPDGFGSFESGLDGDAVHSPGFAVNNAEADPWGSSAWADTNAQEEEEAPLDEWERAKQEKAKQDRRVPPELLASILAQCEELCREMCPESGDDLQTSENDDWRNDRRSGMDGVPGLNNLMESFLPPLTLQPPIRFSQALITKRMASSLKLSKNLPLTRGSPMSHYLTAKGSTAWEISVKERKEVVEDDVPVGWRIVEKAPAALADGTKDKKTGGGLFSFWGRRQSQVSSATSTGADSSRRSSSMEKTPKSPVVDELKPESRRPSQESVRSSMTGSAVQLPSPLSESISPSFAPTLAATPPTMSSYSTAPEPVQERSGTPPAPSAVSRFLNRFSRRSSVGGSPRSSLALSSDDLEFLSDIVPSAADEADEDSTDALEKFVNTKRESLTAVPILPPPLAPPPKAPLTIRPVSAASDPASARSRTSSPAGVSSDLAGLFGSMGSGDAVAAPGAPSPPIAGPPAIPLLAPPLVPSRPLTPASVPGGVGPSKHAVASLSSMSSSPPPRPQTSTPPLSFGLPPPPSFKPVPTSTVKAKPKLSSPFPLPLQIGAQVESGPMSASSTSSASYETAAESSPVSPTSSLPLGEIYPHLVTPTTPPQGSSQAFLFEKPTNFPAVSPATATPRASVFHSGANASLLRPPALSSSAVSPTVTSSLFGGDDFSDFQSPVDQVSPPVPSPIAKSPRTLAAAKAASAAMHASPVQPGTASTLSPFALPPPPGSSSSRSGPPATQPHFASFDDDDFADFQESPMSATSMQPSTTSSTFFGTSASDRSLLTPKNSMSFSSFDDSFESLGTPSPLRPPAKPAASMQPPPLQRPVSQPPSLQPPPLQPPPSQPARLQPPPSQPPHLQPPPLQPPPLQPPPSQPPSLRPAPSERAATHPPPPASMSMPAIPSSSSSSGPSLLARRESKKRSHAADHLHTLSLVEAAAARSGKQWPAPPSPLPAAIPGPAWGAAKGSLFNIMDDDDGSGASAAPALPSSFSSPAVLNPLRPASGMGMGNGTSQSSQPLMGMGFMSSSSTTSSNGSVANPLLQGWDSASSIAQRTSSPTIVPGAPANKSANGVQGTGLSAQDLSFFEGL